MSCNLSLAMIWQMTYAHKLPKLCSATLMAVLTFTLVTVLNIYKARLLQICDMSSAFVCACILIKYQLHFDFLVAFTLLLRTCQLLYHVL